MSNNIAPAIDAGLSQKIADTIRWLSADGVQAAKSGHPGLPMGCADIAAVLLTRVLNIDPNDDKWVNRDRFVLSAGHGSMLLYSMLHLIGYFDMDELKNFRQLGSKTPGHPEVGFTKGVDFTAGPLGAGFAASVGFSLSERMLNEMYNTPSYEIVDHYTYTLMGDGCNQEGISQEAASIAGHLKLGRLIAIYDANGIQIDGKVDLSFSENVAMRYEADGWHVQEIDGHDHVAIAEAIDAAKAVTNKPSLIIAKTTIGKGAPTKQGTAATHGAPLGEEEIIEGKKAANWPTETFYVPAEVTEYFTKTRIPELKAVRAKWEETFESYNKKHKTLGKEFSRVMAGELPKGWKNSTTEFPADFNGATRTSGGQILDDFAALLPEIVGGSADLAESNKTIITKGEFTDYKFIEPGMFFARNIHYGVREHAMGQITNGMAAHGGFIPFCATFLVFSDYMRPAIRMAALSKLRSLFIFTHDSIFVGEDGPTHQPIEHLASMRCMPNVDLWRPADANEAAFAYQAALAKQDGPSVMALTRQDLPTFDRENFAPAKDTLKGGYILEKDPEGSAEICLIASGSEVHLALAVAELLREAGRTVRVVSMPSLDVFKQQSEGYRKKVLPKRFKNRCVIEAGVVDGWEGILGEKGIFIGMDSYGESGPAQKVAEHFGFTVDAVIDKLADADF